MFNRCDLKSQFTRQFMKNILTPNWIRRFGQTYIVSCQDTSHCIKVLPHYAKH